MGPLVVSGDNLPSAVSVDIDIIEQMFEHSSMSPLTLHPTQPRRQQVETLRERIRRLESPHIDQPTLPVLPALEDLFPERGLRRGVVYDLSEGRSLLWSVLSGPSRNGHWIGIVGMNHLGMQAAADAGVDLDRLVLVPEPGRHWWSVAAELADALPLVVLNPLGPLPGPQQRDRLQARLRERGSTLLLRGQWVGSEGRLAVAHRQWMGVGSGHGVFVEQHLTLVHQLRRESSPRRVEISVSARGIETQHRAPVQQIAPRIAQASTVDQMVSEKVAG